MGSFAVGDVVLVAFPYADFSRLKKRPAIVVGKAEFDNLILCQVTSKALTSTARPIRTSDFAKGTLQLDSYARPDKLFTVERSVVDRQVGTLRPVVIERLKADIRALFQ